MGELSFGHPRVVANLLLCALMAFAVSSARGSIARKAAIAACAICTVASLVFLRAPRIGIVSAMFALCVVADERPPGTRVTWLARREVRRCVAAFSQAWMAGASRLALCCSGHDVG